MKKLSLVLAALVAVAGAVWFVQRSDLLEQTIPEQGVSVGQPGSAEVARIADFSGDVRVGRAAASQEARVERVGTTIRPAVLFNQDRLSTADQSTAVLVFAFDGDIGGDSSVEVGPGSRLTLDRRRLPADRARQEGKGQSRWIDLTLGTVRAVVNPNPKLGTEFSTPYGVAAVKGTIIGIGVQTDGTVRYKVEEGVLYVKNPQTGASVTLQQGHEVQVRFDPLTQSLSVNVLDGAGRPVVFGLTDGSSLSMGTGAQASLGFGGAGGGMSIRSDTEGLQFRTRAGDSLNLKAGASANVNVGTDRKARIKLTEGQGTLETRDGESQELEQDQEVETEPLPEEPKEASPVQER